MLRITGVDDLLYSRRLSIEVPHKENWHNPSRIEYIEVGLKKFVNTCAEKGIISIAFPKIG